MIITLSSRELNQDLARAKREALKGPVVITDRGKPAHVLLSFAEYQSLTGSQRSIVDALADTAQEHADIEFAPAKLDISLQPADFS